MKRLYSKLKLVKSLAMETFPLITEENLSGLQSKYVQKPAAQQARSISNINYPKEL